MDSTNEPTDADIRVAQRQFLARLETRLSTLHRVIGAFVGGAGLLVLVPIFFKDSFIDTFSILISARDQAQGLATEALLVVSILTLWATPNRVAVGFSPPAPTPPTVRVRSGRFNELARSTKLFPFSSLPCKNANFLCTSAAFTVGVEPVGFAVMCQLASTPSALTMRFLSVASHICTRASFRPLLAEQPLPSASG